jgi:hypothetical protein
MAEIPLDGPDTPTDYSKTIAATANWAGAAISLALLVGAGVWGYKLLMRDVSGVPVVRAIEGPMREQPLDPGGSQAEHQGLSVNKVAADGTAALPADRLVLAPPPIQLTPEDEPVSLASLPATEQPRAPKPETSAIVSPPAITQTTPIEAPEETATAETPTPEAPAVAAADDAEKKIKVIKGGIGVSLRPQLRPKNIKAGVEIALAEAAASSTVEVDASAIPFGTRLVQLGAFPSADVARSEWDRLQVKFGDYLGDKQRVVQKATSGGRVFYRLRAMGFADLSDARRLCSALKAENADCVPVVTR